MALAHGENYILYSILDFIVDNYMPVIETIHDEVEQLEERVLRDRLDKADVERLYMLRRSLLRTAWRVRSGAASAVRRSLPA